MKYLITILLSVFSFAASAQVMQVNTTAGGLQFRAVKADTMLIIPRGDTVNIGASKWGVSTNGAITFRNNDTALYVRYNNRWYKVSGSGGGGGTTTGGIYVVNENCRDSIFSAADSSFLFYVQRTNGLQSGGIVTHTSGYNYNVTAAYYTLECNDYNSRDTSLTLATAHPSLNRFDVIYVDTSGRAQVRTGTAAANPVVPQIDEVTEILLAIIEVNAGSTGPTITNRLVFDENVSGEWNSHANSSGLTVNYTSSAQAATGSTSAEVSSVTTKDNNISFIRPSGDSIVSGFTTLQFKLRMKQPLRASYMYAYFASGGNNNGSRVGSQVAIPINTASSNSWETIVMNIADFGLATGAIADRLVIRLTGTINGFSGFFIDDIRLLNGSIAPPPSTTDYVQNIRRTGDDVEQQKGGVFAKVFDVSDKLNKADTASLSNRINLKLNIVDTANMMRNAVRSVYRKAGSDSVFAVSGAGTVFAFRDSIGGGSSMIYPGAGIAVSTGSAWGTSITDNSANWNTAFSWGNHASAGYVPQTRTITINGTTLDLSANRSWTVSGTSEIRYNADSVSYYASESGVAGAGTNAGKRNIFIGKFSGYSLQNNAGTDSATTNVGIGNYSLYNNLTGFRNVAIGQAPTGDITGAPLYANTRGVRNVAIGSYALNSNTTGSRNMAMSESSLGANTTGNDNIAAGFESLRLNQTGSGNVAIGSGAARAGTARSNTVAVGINAALGGFTGDAAIAIGSSSAQNALGASSIAIGAGSYGGTGIESTTVGQLAGNFGNGTKNVAVGSYAAYTSGNKSRITAVGHGAGTNITTGSGNTMLGADILNVGGSFTGSWCVGIGYPNAALTFPSLSANYQININNSIVRNSSGQFFLNRNSTPTALPTFTASTAFEVNGTDGGVLFPRLTTTQRNALTGTAGLHQYNTDLKYHEYHDGSTWQAMVGMTFGTAAPTSTPTAIGNFFLDTANKKLYVSTGTSSSADWNILN